MLFLHLVRVFSAVELCMFAIAFSGFYLIEVWTLWHSDFWLSSFIKILMAMVSVVIAVQFVALLPKPQTSSVPSQLEKAREELEARFQQQIGDLIEFNKSLQAEITEYKQREAFLQESEARFRLIAYTAPVMIWVSDIERLCNYFNKVWLEFTGRTIQQEIGYGWLESIHPEDKERCFLTRTTAFDARQSFKMEYRLRRKDGEYRWILDTGMPHYTENNTFAGYIGSCVDITEHKQAEEQIQASLLEKEVLLKEIYHRVKNNLQVISSLLNLQSEYIKDKDDLEIFQQSQMRIESMALIHQKLYQSQDLARIDFGEYIRDLVASLFSSYEVNTNVISLTVNVERVLLSLDAAIPCGLIITELVSNSLKYAFPKSKTGEISIELQVENNNVLNLKVRDNGIGLPKKFDLKNTTSLGLQLVDALTNQLSGNIKIKSADGVEVEIVFPVLEKNLTWRKK
ncbi:MULTISPECIES: sensor histidine kinase [Nostocales]|uniref:histidine kinase n=4 Tax=Nostocales TaxID=1161 RepID=A0A8S9TAU5_9CYAN|nr:histidine kinase dimerization/phosphoacceptor domain -containing protein [Tolypothrix bouteillei]KAF3889167.1 PAS domain S-box protein [Tolypothrix bouteillei VB521301]